MLNIICVMKSGGVYNRDYVQRLARAVQRNLHTQYRFICLIDGIQETEFDADQGIQYEPLLHDLPGWWSKVEMWRPDLEKYGRFLYLDLDQVICGDLGDIVAYTGDVAVTYDFGYERDARLDVPSQTVLNFTPGALREVWDNFNRDPEYWMREGDRRELPFWGDQVLLSKAYTGDLDKYQDLVPGQIISFKLHCNEGLPGNARIVSFHGDPKPHGVALNWVVKNWG